ncbi:MAG: PP2C family protein-serine/threonine phosphatase [Candidatus Aminicenantes bacterium]|nr:PP2C family protein-serine/threonine phosphatase [Candidatus Aminicenantes bacterium]
MEDTGVIKLKRELKLKRFQFNSIYEFSESIYSSFQLDNILRIYFSTLMGQLGVSRAFFYDSGNKLFEKRGFKAGEDEIDFFKKSLEKLDGGWFYLKVEEMKEELEDLKSFLLDKNIHYLVNISESPRKRIVLGLGARFNRKDFTTENIEFSFFVSKFSLIAIENAFLINKIIENKRVEHEMKIARDIQLSLLPQEVPQLKNFEIGVIYQPINKVGGDYYDILKERDGKLPIIIADVEGKGLSAALLAASSQAVLRSLNEFYFFEAEKFISKANSLICDFTRGQRFITLFLMMVDDESRAVTYVNAGHVPPFIVSPEKTVPLTVGGFLTGFVSEAQYEKDTVTLKEGEILVSFTDGVPEVENPEGKEFGEGAVIDYVRRNSHLPAQELAQKLFEETTEFSRGTKFRDDFTLILLKVK